ncbi:MAG: hypothetical protein H0U30_04695 [Actinobacteria bacterium]|nr:hypothetical protein [Actinomycetota bacterium]
MRRHTLGLLLVAIGAVAMTTAAAFAAGGNGGFKTDAAAMLDGRNGWKAEAIISVGDTLGGGYTFEAIPDGIAVERINGKGTADILVNHELSKVPFPSTRQDHLNSTISKLRLHQKSAGVLKGEYVIPQSAGYQRFCSNFLVGAEHGFERELLLTNEEARDIVLRQEDSWHGPSPPGVLLTEPGAEQAGVVVAYDVKSGAYKSIYGMGRHNHENSVGIPGYGYPVVLSGDDTFDAPASQLYLYKAASGADVWNDRGKLYAFVANDPAINDYGDVTEGMGPIPGRFIEVPREIATGKDADDGSEVTSADFGYPLPSASPTTTPPYPKPATAGMPDGPQWVLEHWSNENNVFQFIRVEDIAYDRRPGMSKVVYLADTGEPRAKPSAIAGWTRLERSSSGGGPHMNGRIFKLTLGSNPLEGATLDILPGANFDELGYNNTLAVHQPDNIETTAEGLYIQEDTGSHNGQSAAFPGATNARIWRYPFATEVEQVIAEVNQAIPGAPSTLNRGAWESSGIVDASAVFGPGAFLVDVQAHGWDTEIPGGNDPPAIQKRENGQLLLLRAPGS